MDERVVYNVNYIPLASIYLLKYKYKTNIKMLENRPEDALGSLVKTVETVKTERRILKYLTL